MDCKVPKDKDITIKIWGDELLFLEYLAEQDHVDAEGILFDIVHDALMNEEVKNSFGYEQWKEKRARQEEEQLFERLRKL